MRIQGTAVVLLVTISVAAGMVRAEDPVHFADPNLKAGIEAALGRANPTPATCSTWACWRSATGSRI